ncbi:MAG TPA: hypothetical protein VM915_08980 [Verrucomicrobiae bacterium]|nr:hypothetical protein [Verrucomicrobiae bacterium]
MKKFAAMVAFGLALSTGAAFADTMANAHENTIVVTYPSGAQARYHFNADNTFAAHLPNGHVEGTYTLANGELCITPAGGQRACTPYVGDKNVGESWTQTATDGSTINVTLEAGRSAPHSH